MTERGKSLETMLRVARLNGNYARLQAFAAAAEHPELIDAACVDGGDTKAKCRVPPPQCIDSVENFNSGLAEGDDVEASKFFRAHLPCDRMIEVMREGHPRARPMNADDPVHPCRKGGPRTNESWWAADHAAASEQLRQAEAGEAPLGGTARKHLGLS